MSDPVSVGLLVVRVVLGVVFLAHGIKHLGGRERTTRWFSSIGFRAPGFQWFASTATEIGVGLLFLVGLGTTFAAAGAVAITFVAFISVHRVAGFFITGFMKEGVDVEGYEYVATLAGVAVALAVAGPGRYSIDAKLLIDGVPIADLLDGWAGLAIVGAGIVVALGQLAIFWRPRSVT